MIPLKIRIKNFLSYPSEVQTIDFKDYPLICLSGKNGHGKSALLDAMTWALWGQARKTSGTIKADVGLIRLGQTQMMVSLEFELGGSLYKVRREFTKTFGKPLVVLDFEIFDSQKNRFIPLTDKTIKLTEKKIANLLGLDFETFSNSAFLRQGQANEFSKKTPKERKQILANILGLSRYDELQRLASENVRKLDSDKKVLSGILQKTNEEIGKESRIEEDQKKEQTNLKIININLNKQQKYLLILDKEKHIKEEKKKVYISILKDIRDLKKLYDEKLNKFKSLILAWKKTFYKTLQISSVDDLEKLRSELSKKDKELLLTQQKSLDLQGAILKKKSSYQKELTEFKRELEQEIYGIKLNLEKELLGQQQIEEQIKQKEKNIIDIDKNIESKNKELVTLKNKCKNKQRFFEEFEKNKTQFDKRRSFYNLLVQRGNWIKVHVDELMQKIDSLKKSQTPSCPLCQQVLTIKRKQFLSYRFKTEDKFYIHQMNRISILLKKLKGILFEQNEQIKKLQKQYVEHKESNIRLEELEKTLGRLKNELKKEEKNIANLNLKIKESIVSSKIIKNSLDEKVKELEQELKNNSFLKSIKNEIEKFEYEFENLKYDKEFHIKTQKELQRTEKTLEEYKTLKDSLIQQKQKRAEISFVSTQLKELGKAIKSNEQKIKDLKLNEKDEKILLENIVNLKKQINKILLDKEYCLQNLGKIQNEIDRIRKLKTENVVRQKEIDTLSEESKYYQFLTRTFGRDGIQALLIEQAIPEIEQEANKILSRLTDNQSQIFFESLRDLKKGGVKETLDIQISDSVGLRPYEMFSGGEAFRVDFALRIAISKLLARRSGAALQTLIIDEGFGSQDEEGLSRLMDAIYAIQQDFAKIIVVSHLDVFRDNFPIHFIVNKSSSGSFVTIQERG